MQFKKNDLVHVAGVLEIINVEFLTSRTVESFGGRGSSLNLGRDGSNSLFEIGLVLILQ